MASDLISGFEAGQGVVDRYAGYEQQKVRTGQINRELDQRAQFEADRNSLLKAQLDLQASHQSDLRRQLETDMQIKQAQLKWETQAHEQRLKQTVDLIGMQKEMADLTMNPVGPDYVARGAQMANKYGHLLVSDDPAIRQPALAAQKQFTDLLNVSSVGQLLAQKSEAYAQGFIPLSQKGQAGAEQNGLLALDMSQMHQYANSQGVNLDDPKYEPVMESLKYNQSTGQLLPESKAKLRAVVDAEALKIKSAQSDKSSKVKFSFGGPQGAERAKAQMMYPGAKLDPNEVDISLDDLLNNPTAQGFARQVLGQQGIDVGQQDKMLGIAADEAGKPRLQQAGTTFRWSASLGKYVPVSK